MTKNVQRLYHYLYLDTDSKENAMTKVHISELTARYDAGAEKAKLHGQEVRAKIQAQRDLNEIEIELMKAQAALREARDITNSWKASMEAWKDLALALREEIENCPNNDAHKFGKDREARQTRHLDVKNRHRKTWGLEPIKL